MSKRDSGGAIRIAVAATSAVRRAGLEKIVSRKPEFQLAGRFGAVAGVLSSVRSNEVDVVVIDSDSIQGVSLEPTSSAAIVLITEVTDGRSISRLLRSGVRAILSRESDADNILSGIYAAYDGLVLLNITAAESLAAVYGDHRLEVESELSEEVTARETGVLKMLAEGLVNKDISTRLGIAQPNEKYPI